MSTTIEERISEAHDNYINGRFANAARILQAPIQTLSSSREIKDFLDAFYMTHFRMVALHRSDNNLELVTTLREISRTIMQYAAKLAMLNVQQESQDVTSKIEFMKQARNCFTDLGMEQEEESLRLSLIAAMNEVVDQSDDTNQLLFLKQLFDLCTGDEHLQAAERIVQILGKDGERLHAYNQRERETGGIVKDIEEAQINIEIASYLRHYDVERMRTHLKIAFECSATAIRIFNKHDFPKFTSIEDIENYSP